MNTCGTCKYRDESGYCLFPKLASDGGVYTPEERDEMLLYDACADGSLRVGAKFGCVHHDLKAP